MIATIKRAGLRVSLDLRNKTIGYKIREASLKKVPFLLVIDEQEKAEGCVTLRIRACDNIGSPVLNELVARLSTEMRMPGRSGHADPQAA